MNADPMIRTATNALTNTSGPAVHARARHFHAGDDEPERACARCGGDEGGEERRCGFHHRRRRENHPDRSPETGGKEGGRDGPPAREPALQHREREQQRPDAVSDDGRDDRHDRCDTGGLRDTAGSSGHERVRSRDERGH